MATIVYIDGFNLYYGAVKDTKYKWLDLVALCDRLLPKEEITKIRYFTARVVARPKDPQQPVRQETYLRALATFPQIEIHFGHFSEHRLRLPLANPTRGTPNTVEVLKTEEKGSDVNLATYLLRDAFRNECATAVVVSNDSDLAEPVRVLRTETDVRVGIINPHPERYRSRELRGTFFKQLRRSTLHSCQLPETLQDDNGTIRKPAGW